MSEAENMEAVEDVSTPVDMTDVVEEVYDDWDDIPTLNDKEAEEEAIEYAAKERELDEKEFEEVKAKEAAKKEAKKEAKEEIKEEQKEVKEEIEEPKSEESDNKEGEKNLDEQLIEVKVDGKLEEVSLQDLKNNYSGKVAYDKKFTEVDVQKKALQSEIDGINKYVAELGETMNNGSMLDGMYKVGELNSIPPHIIKAQLIKELVPEIQRLQELSQSEIDLEHQRAENDYMKNKYESEKSKLAKEQASMDLQSQIDAIRANHNIEQNEWDTAFQHLDKTLPPNDVITPELMQETILDSRISVRAENALKEVEASLINDVDVLNSLKTIMKDNPDFTDEDIKDILDSSYNKPKEQSLAQKIEKKVEKQPEEKQTTITENDYDVSWDDIL